VTNVKYKQVTTLCCTAMSHNINEKHFLHNCHTLYIISIIYTGNKLHSEFLNICTDSLQLMKLKTEENSLENYHTDKQGVETYPVNNAGRMYVLQHTILNQY